MTPEEVSTALERTGAMLTGHFLLSSGLHSDRYVQCALALREPDLAEALGTEIAAKFIGERATLVAGPALGGVIVAHEVARALGVPCIFSERDGEGRMTFRRGFSVSPEDRVVLAEDTVTTGTSILELAALVRSAGAAVLGFGAIVDRSGGRSRLPAGIRALLTLEAPAWEAGACPLCARGSQPVKPGSRPQPAAR